MRLDGRAERPEEELRHNDDDELVGRAANVDLSCVHDPPEQVGAHEEEGEMRLERTGGEPEDDARGHS